MKSADPWRVPVVVAQIPDTGLHRAFEASETTRAAMADLADLREVMSATASFDLTPKSGGRVHVTGEVRARADRLGEAAHRAVPDVAHLGPDRRHAAAVGVVLNEGAERRRPRELDVEVATARHRSLHRELRARAADPHAPHGRTVSTG